MNEFKVGDKVRYVGKSDGEYYPVTGTIGTVIAPEDTDGDYYVDWGEYSGTKPDYCWHCNSKFLQLVSSVSSHRAITLTVLPTDEIIINGVKLVIE